MATTDIVTIGGVALTASGMLGHDCAMPITRLTKRLGTDEVLMNMPVFLGHWNTGTVQPVELDQVINIDTSGVTGACDVAVVDAAITEGELVLPDQAKIKLATPTLVLDELVPKFCRSRNITERELGLVMNRDGSLNEGNPYMIDFARFALATLSKAMAQLITRRVMRGDASDDFGLDGFYTQLEDGWAMGTPAIPAYLNQAIVIDWQTLTGAGAATTPDDLTVASQTLDLWGTTFNVPVGINLVQLLEDYLIPAVEAHWTDQNGGVDVWEIHVPPGSKRCLIDTAACFQPCNNDAGIWDTTLRERIIDLRARDVVRLFPSGREIPMWESTHVEADTMWFGPRSIGGNPTYGVVFRDMNEMFAALGVLGDTYGQGSGMFPDTEPLLTSYTDDLGIPFEASAIHWDVRKVSIDCVQAALMSVVGVLAAARHLWFKIEGITCGSFIDNDIQSGLQIDNASLESGLAAVTLSTPADDADVTDTTPALDWDDLTGATSYTVQIAADENFDDIVEVGNPTASTHTVTTTLTEDADYYWRVRGRNADGPGPWSVARRFVVNAA
jgi:hypothetical protein